MRNSPSSLLERFLGALTANIGAKIISVLIAVVFWMVVLASKNVEVSKEIPLQVIAPVDAMVANDLPNSVTYKLSGPKAFLRTALDRREDPIVVDLSGAKPGLVTYRFFSDNIRVPIGVKVLSINPAAILIKLDQVKKKEVPVRVELRGSAPEGFRVAKTLVRPDVVRIKGPETRIDAVTEVSTMLIDVSHLKQSVDYQVAMDMSRLNVQLDGSLPHVMVEIEPISANYRIKNVEVRVLTNLGIRLNEKTVTVLVRAEAKDLKLLDRNHVYAIVDLSGKPKGKYVEAVKVTLPEEVGFVKTVPERVSVTLY